MSRKKEKTVHNINMVVRDDSDFLSVFSTREAPVISSEVADFLEKSVPLAARKSQLKLTICSNCITETEQYVYKCAIKEYFRELYNSTKAKIKHKYVLASILAVIGAVLLAATHLIADICNVAYVVEFVNVIACFFLWESVSQAALKAQELRMDKQKYVAFLNMHVNFKNRD